MVGTRDGAIAWALAQFDSGAFRTRLADLVAIPSTSQEPEHARDVTRDLTDAIRPWLERLGFTNVHSLTGGIDAWSCEVDPTVPRY